MLGHIKLKSVTACAKLSCQICILPDICMPLPKHVWCYNAITMHGITSKKSLVQNVILVIVFYMLSKGFRLFEVRICYKVGE